jgi:hypothetical protein
MRNSAFRWGSLLLALLVSSSALGDRVQFGGRSDAGPVDGGARVVDWVGRYLNYRTGKSGQRARFGSLLTLSHESGSRYLEEPLSELRMFCTEYWAADRSVGGTLSLRQHSLGIAEGPTTGLDPKEALVFTFNQPVKLHSLFWEVADEAAVSLQIGDKPMMNTISGRLQHLEGEVLASGQELRIRVEKGSVRLGAITVETFTPKAGAEDEDALIRAALPADARDKGGSGVTRILVHICAAAAIALITMVTLLTVRRER